VIRRAETGQQAIAFARRDGFSPWVSFGKLEDIGELNGVGNNCRGRSRKPVARSQRFPLTEAAFAVFTAGNRISTRRPRAAAILRSIARLWPA